MRLGFDMTIVQTVKVFCRECGKYNEFKSTRILQRPRVHEVFEFYRKLEIPNPKEYGWWTDGMGQLVCPKCIQKRNVAERKAELEQLKNEARTTLPIKPLRTWREERNMLQRDLAARIGVSNSTIGCWEKGKAKPTKENLSALAAILGVELEQIKLRCM